MKRKKRRRRKKTASGASLARLLLFAVSFVALGFAAPPERAVIAGTVFRDPGFALPGAEVSVEVSVPPQGAKPPKPQKTATDARGEFAFYLPPLKAEYRVTVKARGHQSQSRVAQLSGGVERVDLYFTLLPDSPQGK